MELIFQIIKNKNLQTMGLFSFKKKTEVLVKSPKGDIIMRFSGEYADILLNTIGKQLEDFTIETITMESGSKYLIYKHNLHNSFINFGTDNNELKLYLDKGTIIYKIL